MLNVDSISWGFYTAVASDPVIVNSGMTVELELDRNTEAAKTPWVGVYYEGTNVEPARAGDIATPFMAQHRFRIECMTFDGLGVGAARTQVYRVLDRVLTAVNTTRIANSTLGGAVDMFLGLTVEPPETTIDGEGGWAFVTASLLFERRA